MTLIPCLVCGRPCPRHNGGRCSAHPRARPSHPQNPAYSDPAYRRNRKIMADYAWSAGIPCVICGGEFEARSEITAEHLIPLRRGGGNDLGNLAPAHRGCNSGWSKGAGTTEPDRPATTELSF